MIYSIGEIILNPEREQNYSMPTYYPGDIVTDFDGNVGVITEAHVIINGKPYNWNKKFEGIADHGWTPQYSVDFFVRKTHPKTAWWKSHEWQKVQLGLVHNELRLKNDN